MHVAVYCTLKENWAQYVHEWLSNHLDDPMIMRKDFSKLLKEVVDEDATHSELANGYCKCGPYPWDPIQPRVAGHKNDIAVQNPMQNDDFYSRLNYVKQGFQFWNESSGKDKLKLFEPPTVDWEGDPSDRSLFVLWKKTEFELKRLNTNSKQTASNDNTPFEEGEDFVGPSNVLSPIVEGNEDTAITGPSHLLSSIVQDNEDTAIAAPSHALSP